MQLSEATGLKPIIYIVQRPQTILYRHVSNLLSVTIKQRIPIVIGCADVTPDRSLRAFAKHRGDPVNEIRTLEH